MTPTLTIAEYGEPARRQSRCRDARARPHRWLDGRCERCAMRETWAGAAYACAGYSQKEPLR